MSDKKSVEMTGAKPVPESTKSQATPEITINHFTYDIIISLTVIVP